RAIDCVIRGALIGRRSCEAAHRILERRLQGQACWSQPGTWYRQLLRSASLPCATCCPVLQPLARCQPDGTTKPGFEWYLTVKCLRNLRAVAARCDSEAGLLRLYRELRPQLQPAAVHGCHRRQRGDKNPYLSLASSAGAQRSPTSSAAGRLREADEDEEEAAAGLRQAAPHSPAPADGFLRRPVADNWQRGLRQRGRSAAVVMPADRDRRGSADRRCYDRRGKPDDELERAAARWSLRALNRRLKLLRGVCGPWLKLAEESWMPRLKMKTAMSSLVSLAQQLRFRQHQSSRSAVRMAEPGQAQLLLTLRGYQQSLDAAVSAMQRLRMSGQQSSDNDPTLHSLNFSVSAWCLSACICRLLARLLHLRQPCSSLALWSPVRIHPQPNCIVGYNADSADGIGETPLVRDAAKTEVPAAQPTLHAHRRLHALLSPVTHWLSAVLGAACVSRDPSPVQKLFASFGPDVSAFLTDSLNHTEQQQQHGGPDSSLQALHSAGLEIEAFRVALTKCAEASGLEAEAGTVRALMLQSCLCSACSLARLIWSARLLIGHLRKTNSIQREVRTSVRGHNRDVRHQIEQRIRTRALGNSLAAGSGQTEPDPAAAKSFNLAARVLEQEVNKWADQENWAVKIVRDIGLRLVTIMLKDCRTRTPRTRPLRRCFASPNSLVMGVELPAFHISIRRSPNAPPSRSLLPSVQLSVLTKTLNSMRDLRRKQRQLLCFAAWKPAASAGIDYLDDELTAMDSVGAPGCSAGHLLVWRGCRRTRRSRPAQKDLSELGLRRVGTQRQEGQAETETAPSLWICLRMGRAMSLSSRICGFTAWVNLRLQHSDLMLSKNVLMDLMSGMYLEKSDRISHGQRFKTWATPLIA
uniref:HECT domain-containing protein n=1 Tax=Macrostomum lignano TaxID=282301 RepID=A0A1I8FNR7_9PLAT